MDKTLLLCASGVISFSVYTGLVLLFLFLGFVPRNEPLRFSSKKEVEFQITLDAIPTLENNKKPMPIEREQKRVESKTDNVGSKTPVAGVGIKKLFDSIPNKTTPKPQDITDSRDTFASRKKGDSPQQQDLLADSVHKILSQLDIKPKINFTVPEGEYNEYYAQVDSILSEHWRDAKYQDNSGKDVRADVLITINSDGKFFYRIQKLSGDANFDNILRIFLDDMTSISFPKYIHNTKRETNIVITIGSER